MRATARFLLPDGEHQDLGHGDLIGRLWSAALHLDDARISEAHAMVSLRGRELKLLALRGRFAVDGRALAEVSLRAGMEILVAPGVSLRVERVVLPDEVLGVEGDGLALQVLGGVCSLVTRPRPALIPRFEAGAAAHIWTTGEGWRLQPAGAPARTLAPGDAWRLGGRSFRAVAVSLEVAGQRATRLGGALRAPLTVIARYDTAHVHRGDEPAVALGGIAARIISELVAFGGPVRWEVLAGEIWRGATDPHSLRRKLDVNLSRLRAKLKAAGVRTDLVRADGAGHLELYLATGDRAVDET